ncbi:hypothetical protein [Hyalangium rubrum]|uniref:Pentapeptide repeat-containing protein n=1 Tax=Hyalangium rubrum TaxID=3103134 RepID=A0ABU5GYV6_9BACT|nr:hypothetical protein [Hyalangium sp. s54d21]MDY7226388.1 hypothetical protein [Hyalangium sp. s54d21]
MSQVNLEDRELTNERLELGSGTTYFLGPNLTLKNCTLVLKVSSRSLIVPQARFIDCTLDVRKELKGFRWEHAIFKSCRFTGRLRGNDFGRWPDSLGAQGGIEDCDFTGAHLDGCRFIGCDTRTLRFPEWPCFTLLDPGQRWREWSAVAWPGDIGRVVIRGFEEYPPLTVAVTYSAPDLAKRSGTTPEAIKATLQHLDGVKY